MQTPCLGQLHQREAGKFADVPVSGASRLASIHSSSPLSRRRRIAPLPIQPSCAVTSIRYAVALLVHVHRGREQRLVGAAHGAAVHREQIVSGIGEPDVSGPRAVAAQPARGSFGPPRPVSGASIVSAVPREISVDFQKVSGNYSISELRSSCASIRPHRQAVMRTSPPSQAIVSTTAIHPAPRKPQHRYPPMSR